MKIAVNTRLLLPGKLEGIGWFTYETMKRIVKQHPEHEFHFIFDRTYDPDFIFADNVKAHVLSPPARHPFLFYLWFEWRLPSLLRKIKPDVFLSPDGYLSLSSSVKQLAVIHDINFEYYPSFLPLGARIYLKTFFPKFAHKATRIATVSEFSKNDISSQYNIDNSLIDVVYNGASSIYKPVEEDEKKKVKADFTNGSEYFVYVGAIQPRKNITNLMLAFEQFKIESGSDQKLVLVGEKKWWSKRQEETFDSLTYKKDIIFTGRLEQDELNLILGSAMALTYVSLFEGFGIPILEAMNCDVPVLTSSVTSMPEVAGEAALLVNPFTAESIADGMLELHQKPKLRKELVLKGREQRAFFNWDKTADLMWQSITKTADQ
ncbi:glycosyltransferase family 4 protein [Salibacter halophilus]|uniref:Glycosyltransferase family 4 protein n=1 Tax=Salibacter halophilus TaxID=1803916 RepID=A0A6N6M1N7_9FLAO|nr:glycosyltransferase family 1 protein [Salibacter halophilus]KAB1062142.1 glycosyltransferase family 4 protein [Salibacter halophilus]